MLCNFRFGYPQPIYINIIRDPIKRAMSFYYYVRHMNTKVLDMTEAEKNMVRKKFKVEFGMDS